MAPSRTPALFVSALALASAALADMTANMNNYIKTAGNQTSTAPAYFLPRQLTYSQGGHAVCASGIVKASISALNTKLIIPTPANQFVVTEIIQEALQTNSTILTTSAAGTVLVQGTYDIAAVLCYPTTSTSFTDVKGVQILTHGSGLQKNYWDLAAPNNSYVDAAAQRGYATLSYDRLGAGGSAHPDPINVVQSMAQVEVIEALVQGARRGGVAPAAFANVVCVAHSYGSILQLVHDRKYPNASCSSVVATGIADTFQYLVGDTFALNPTIAAQADPKRFGGLDNSFWLDPLPGNVQLPFFRYPYFDPAVFNAVYNGRQTYTLGEVFTTTAVIAPAPAYAGPVAIVDGQYDIPFCGGDCGTHAASYRATYYPAATRSQATLIPNTGHVINGHITAPLAFKVMLDFIDSCLS